MRKCFAIKIPPCARPRVRVYARSDRRGRTVPENSHGNRQIFDFSSRKRKLLPRHAGHFITEFPGAIRAPRNPLCVVTHREVAEGGGRARGRGERTSARIIQSLHPIEKETKMNSGDSGTIHPDRHASFPAGCRASLHGHRFISHLFYAIRDTRGTNFRTMRYTAV